jgi:two-component system, OmpR family, phosphate regulon sensor histidine kinase PhoR
LFVRQRDKGFDLKKRSITIIIGLMSFALLGVVGMQAYFLIQSYRQQSALFDSSVHEALNNVANKLGRQDAINFLDDKARQNVAQPEFKNQVVGITDKQPSGTLAGDPAKQRAHNRRKAKLLDSLNHLLDNEKLEDMARNLRVNIEGYTDEYGNMHINNIVPELKKPLHDTAHHGKLEKYKYIQVPFSDPQYGMQTLHERVINPAWVYEQQRIIQERQIKAIRKMKVPARLPESPT